jgi:hypothetical protein
MSQHDPDLLLPRAIEAGAHACVDKSHLSTQLLPTIASMMDARDTYKTPRP